MSATYAYDYQNRRYKKTIGSSVTHYVWEGSGVIGEYNGSSGALLVQYGYAGSRMISKTGSGATQYFLTDRLSIRLALSDAGVVVGRQATLPFGEDFAESGTQEKHHFTSYDRDVESGTDYAVNRQYTQSVGRFNRVDPLSGSARTGAPQTWNRYSYTVNEPVNHTDPSGLELSSPYNPWYCPPWLGCYDYREGWIPTDENDLAPTEPTTWQVDPKVLGKCIQDLYGVTLTSFAPARGNELGVFVGFGPDRGMGGNDAIITIRNDASRYNKSQLKEMENASRAAQGLPLLGPNEEVWGMTIDDATHNHYTNYTASDLTKPLDFLKNQVHELGHSLALVTGIEGNAHSTGWEQGDKLEKCVSQNNGWVLK